MTEKKNIAWKKILLYAIAIGGGLMVLGILVVGAYVLYIVSDLPDIGNLENGLVESTVILDRDGNELYNMYDQENREYVPLDKISQNFLNAMIVIEDRRFYEHPGVDLVGIARAFVSNLQGKKLQGASTLTQQLVKNLVLKTSERTYEKKIKEIFLAYQVEQRYDKNKILELYVNQVPFGNNSNGIQMAAKSYFGKDAADLDLAESAILAALPNGPSYYSPFGENKYRLLGYCKAGETSQKVGGLTESDTKTIDQGMTISILARERVWLKILPDGKEEGKFEGTLEKGQQAEVKATDFVEVTAGNKSYDLFANSTQVTLPKDLNYTLHKSDIPTTDQALSNSINAEETSLYQGIDGCSSMEDPNYVKGRKDVVLDLLEEDGYITHDEKEQAWKESHNIVFTRRKENIKYPHFVMYVKQYLEEKYGQEVASKGYRVKTTIDPTLQDIAEETVKKYGDQNERYDASNMAMVAVQPGTGQILAMVGSRDYWDTEHDGNVNVAVSRRQPGSSFKPFVYASMFEGPWGPGSSMWDVETKFGADTPQNYEGGFKGPMTARTALAQSRNIPAIKAFFLAGGEEKILDFVAKLGFDYLKNERDARNEGKPEEEKWYYGWPIALGTGESRPLDMAAGYAAFANNGTYVPPIPVLEITDANGEVIEYWEEHDNSVSAMDPQVAYEIADILSDPEARPAGSWRTTLTVPGQDAGAKTGTSNKRYGSKILPSDLWTVGFTKYMSVAVWAGNNDGSPATASAAGLLAASPAWKAFMVAAHKDKEKLPFEKPEGITTASVSRLSGLRPSSETPKEYVTSDIFSSWSLPKGVDQSKEIKVDSRNGLLATDDCSDAVVETKIQFKVQSEMPSWSAWENPVQAWAKAQGLGGGGDSSNSNGASDGVSPLCKKTPDGQQLTLSIVTPENNGTVGAGKVNVQVSYKAPIGLSKVEYYIDGTLAMTRTAEPFNIGFVDVPNDSNSHTIRVIGYDANYYTSSDEIAVKVAADVGKPSISLSSPTVGSSYPLQSSIPVDVTVVDDMSAVANVDIYFDGNLVRTFTAPPYSFSIFLNSKFFAPGKHDLRVVATDTKGNAGALDSSVTITDPVTSNTANTNENAVTNANTNAQGATTN